MSWNSVEGFLLVLDQRIFLAVAAQADAFLQVVHRQQVVFPLVVDDVEHDHALGVAHDIGPDQLFLFVVALGELIEDGVFDLGAVQAGQFLRIDLHAELGEHVGLQPGIDPTWSGCSFSGQRVSTNACDDPAYHFEDALLLLVAFEQARRMP